MKYHTKPPLSLGIDPGIGNTGWALVNRILSTEIKNNHKADSAAVAIAGLLFQNN